SCPFTTVRGKAARLGSCAKFLFAVSVREDRRRQACRGRRTLTHQLFQIRSGAFTARHLSDRWVFPRASFCGCPTGQHSCATRTPASAETLALAGRSKPRRQSRRSRVDAAFERRFELKVRPAANP